jgi:hypothetical protein
MEDSIAYITANDLTKEAIIVHRCHKVYVHGC